MASVHERISGAAASFWSRSDGGVTVEFVLWVPVFLTLMLVTVDTSLVFLRQSNFWNVSRDTARIVSRHGLDAEAAERYARTQAQFGATQPDVSVRVDSVTSTVTVTISARPAQLAPFGVLNFALGERISAQVTHALEPI